MTSVLGVPLPEALTRSAAHWGEAGARWIDSLSERVDDLVGRWALTVQLPLYTEGQCSIVVPVTTSEGAECVLKVGWPHAEAENEAAALRAYDGHGAVRLFAEDGPNNALLLERCEPGSSAWTAGDGDAVLAVCANVVQRLWRPVQVVEPFELLSDASARRAEDMRKTFVDFGRPFDAALAERGASMFESLAESSVDPVLLHGDFHPSNVLRAKREPWLAVDPKPLVGDRAFDTAQLLLNFYRHEWPMDETIWKLTRTLDLDIHRVTGWLFARAVEEITWTLKDGEPIEDALVLANLCAQLIERDR